MEDCFGSLIEERQLRLSSVQQLVEIELEKREQRPMGEQLLK
jgi:hypothetical protein